MMAFLLDVKIKGSPSLKITFHVYLIMDFKNLTYDIFKHKRVKSSKQKEKCFHPKSTQFYICEIKKKHLILE